MVSSLQLAFELGDSLFCGMSVDELQRELNDSRISRRSDLPECRTRDRGIGIAKLCKVECVEELGPELHTYSLAPAEACHLGDSEIEVGAARPAEEVTRERAVRAQRWIGH